MAAVVKAAQKAANQDLTVPVPVGKKIYGIVGVYATNIHLVQNGIRVRMLDNSGATREVWFPAPIEFAAATSFIFTGTSSATIGIIYEE